ncbi:hypothetical protein AYI70_g1572 [Smittium culicis]|uniref:Uncharacterized protein n=1 Tax=Smittium culicis TaxID=133412 RepID=A0A1R1YBZ8_9FUNG|nr:hypothetical protein AYI70_g1572 [Smittium culicis]
MVQSIRILAPLIVSFITMLVVRGSGYEEFKEMELYNDLKNSGLDLEAMENSGFMPSLDNVEIINIDDFPKGEI